jgi:uncharacterized membrane protein
MNKVLNSTKEFLLRPYLYLIIALLGTSLRFYKLGNRFFWVDEIYTIMTVSGIDVNQYHELIPENEIKNINYYTDFLHLNKQNYTIGSQLKGLSKIATLNPLQYAFLIFWHRIAGDDPVDYRLFNVFVFILTLPFLFLLARTLFKTNLAGWIAVSLYSVSPFFHFYVQEARYMTLWAFFLILSNYFLVQAIQHNKSKWWIGYSVAGILALYTSITSGLLIIGHFVYVMIFKKELRIKYCINAVIILLGYLPWIIAILHNRVEITAALAWHSDSAFNLTQSFWKLIASQLIGFILIFEALTDPSKSFYAYLLFYNKLPAGYIELLTSVLILAVIISSIIYVLKKEPKEIAFFLALIILPQFLFFYISDLIRSSGTSFILRYHVINFIGIILFVVYFLSQKLKQGKYLYSGIYLGLVIVGIVSVLSISRDRFWGMHWCKANVEEAQLFSSDSKPLLITDFSFPLGLGLGGLMTVLNECESENIDILRASPDIDNLSEKIPEKEYSEIYVVHASDELVQNLKIQFGEKMDSLKLKDQSWSKLWQIDY